MLVMKRKGVFTVIQIITLLVSFYNCKAQQTSSTDLEEKGNSSK